MFVYFFLCKDFKIKNKKNLDQINFCPICLIEENSKTKNNRHCFTCNS